MNSALPTEPQDERETLDAIFRNSQVPPGSLTIRDLTIPAMSSTELDAKEQAILAWHHSELDRVRAEAEAIIRKERPIFLRKGDSDPTGEETVAIRNQLRQEILNDFAALTNPKGDK